MNHRVNIIGLCLLAMFMVIFGSIVVMPLLAEGNGVPGEVSVEAVAAKGDE
ncbi:hypothetical protein [Shinella sp. G-2]|uniref:hypothetical protein n=1 Tax=Shinella sp. G-2 TaxID=3133141 RepID=UPI003D00A12B